jgi:hypothetical protein
MQRNTPAEHAAEFSDKPMPDIKKPALKRKSQLSAKIKRESHRARGIEARPALGIE